MPDIQTTHVRPTEALDQEMGAIMGRLVALGLDQASINTIQLAALVTALVDKGLLSETEWAEHVIKMLKEVEQQAQRASILRRTT